MHSVTMCSLWGHVVVVDDVVVQQNSCVYMYVCVCRRLRCARS